MVRRRLIPVCILLLSGCGPKEEIPLYKPAIRVTLEEASAYQVRLTILSVDAAAIRYGYAAGDGLPSLTETLPAESIGSARMELVLKDLTPQQSYCFAAQGIGPGGEEGSLQEVHFSTGLGPGQLYEWEKARNRIPVPADMTLIPGPSSHRKPLEWSRDRWSKHVSYTDESGKEHWLFDCFLLIEGQQTGLYGSPGHTYVLTESYQPSAPKELWQQLLDFWFDGGTFLSQESYWGDGITTFGRWYTGRMVSPSPVFADGQLSELDACVRATASRIGEPPSPRYVVMALPEPIYFENYIASVNTPAAGNTRYWGPLDGQEMDFSRVEDRIRACRWFIDETRAAFARKQYGNIELLGFYILPEVLDTQWRAQYKKYDEVIPAIADYLHACNEGLYWIPYNMAAGYKSWKDFGIDIAYMQPNYYWDETGDHPMRDTFREINRYGMGLELEFEYSMVENVNGAASAGKYRARFLEYLRWARESGVYGSRSIALYSGTDAMQQLADSPLPGDRETYHALGHFLIDNPLKQP